MISKNIVLIETIDSIGTGFLYPCKYEGASSCRYFIVLTNAHVLQSIGLDQQVAQPHQNYKGQIILSFYDNLGNKVDQENIREIRVYNSGNFMRSEEDIAAMLVAVESIVPMVLETAICHRQLDNRETLYLEGYPGVLLDDEVCSRIQLEGMEKKIFPPAEKMGVYQITDDYHWYNDYKDRGLLQGLSGSVIYVENGGKAEILGMAQSVSDIQQGENPFKLMYYIKFSHILKHLREANCIIFFRESEDCYQIQWIYGMQAVSHKEEKKMTLLLLGGSGAGKSSFAKDFAYHGNQICSTNDGQTTRTKVIYNYGIFNKNKQSEKKGVGNFVDVKILTKDEFIERMMEKVGQRPALLMMQAVFRLEDASIKETVRFLENCHTLLHILWQSLEELSNQKQSSKTWWPERMLDDIRAGIYHQLSNKKMIKCYEDMIETLCTYLPICTVKYFLDEHCMMEVREKYKQAEQEGHDSVSIFRKLNSVLQEAENIQSLCDREVVRDREAKEESTNMYISELLNMEETKGYCASSADCLDVWFKKFQKAAVRLFLQKYYVQKKEPDAGNVAEQMPAHLGEKEFHKTFLDSLVSIEGYFALEEFQDILSEHDKDELFRDREIYKRNVVFDDKTEDTDWDNRRHKRNFHMEFCSIMEETYGELHGRIKQYLVERYAKYGIKDNYLNIRLYLDDMNEETRKLLQKCLQVTPHGSLTGMVNYVAVHDMISDEYAAILKDLQISTLQLVDTCGLDHVGMIDQQELKNRLYDTLYYYDGDRRFRLEDISILYLKKLDSGKPDELRQVVPCVREVFPASPVYCIFTGIDIFYRTPDEIDSLNWKRTNDWQPKAVSYLLSDKGKKILENATDGVSVNMAENMYLVMRNNLVPYCGKKNLIMNHYAYYKNNTVYIRKLLASIAMKEYSSLEIIDTTLIDLAKEVVLAQNADNAAIEDIMGEKTELTDGEKDEYKSKIENILEAAEELIKYIFCEASLKSYSFRYNTKQADISSFCKRNKLGYYGTYRHRMDQRFHEAYGKAVEKKGRALAENFPESQAALIGALKNMETKYLGSGNNLTDVKTNNRNEFRKILEKMYSNDYRYNPFDDEYGQQDFYEKRDEIFDEIFNFSKGLNNDDIMKEFVQEFILCLKKQIHEDNRQKSKNLLKLNPDFTEILGELERSYLEKYRTDSKREQAGEQEEQKKMRKKFRELMNYYFAEQE